MIDAAVVDASVVAKRVILERDSEKTRVLFEARLEAPDIMLVECASILWKKNRAGDLTPSQAADRLRVLIGSPIALVPSLDLLVPAMQLSFEIGHPVYDCLYLALAIRSGLPLVTDDLGIVTAARRRKPQVRVLLLSEIA